MYYISKHNGTKKGPFSEEVVLKNFQSGEYSSDTLVWCEGMDTWESIQKRFHGIQPSKKEFSSRTLPPEMPSLPDVKSIASYYVNAPDGQKGPLSYNDLKSMFQQGEVSEDNWVWEEGTSYWVRAREIVAHRSSGTFVKGMADSVAGWVGTEKITNFSAKHFFGDIFKKHTESEVIDFFCAGGPNTTPRLDQIMATWPSPWVFTRVLILSLLLYFGFDWMAREFENPKTIPGLMFAGNFAIPFSFLVLFAELNIRRDVPWFAIIKMLIGGGLISLIFASILFKQSNPMEAYWAGPIEEPAKLLAAVFMARRFYLNGHILTGVLCGAAVGAGFAIFESAGYVFENLVALMSGRYSDPDAVMIMRALLSPFGHIVWTAITAGALWRVMAQDRFSIDKLLHSRFLRIAIVPVILHMFWNSSLMTSSENIWYLKVGLCGLIGWLLVLLLVNEGINQVRDQQSR